MTDETFFPHVIFNLFFSIQLYLNQKWHMNIFFFFCNYSCIHQIKSLQCHCVDLAGLLSFLMTSFEKGFNLNFGYIIS